MPNEDADAADRKDDDGDVSSSPSNEDPNHDDFDVGVSEDDLIPTENIDDIDHQNDSSHDQDEDEDRQQCYICWSDETSPEDPIRRDCGCRGSAGYAHIQCLVSAAESKGLSDLLDPITRQWRTCDQCLQPYTGPTKDALKRTMVGDRSRLMRRILASIVHAVGTVAQIYIAVWSLILWLAVMAILLLVTAVLFAVYAGPPLRRIWNFVDDSGPMAKLAIGGILLLIILGRTYQKREVVKRIAGRFAVNLAANVLVEIGWENAWNAPGFAPFVFVAGLGLVAYGREQYRRRAGPNGRFRRPIGIAGDTATYALHLVVGGIIINTVIESTMYVYSHYLESSVTHLYDKYLEEQLMVALTSTKEWLLEQEIFADIKAQFQQARAHTEFELVADIKAQFEQARAHTEFELGLINVFEYIERDPFVAKEMDAIRQDYVWCCA